MEIFRNIVEAGRNWYQKNIGQDEDFAVAPPEVVAPEHLLDVPQQIVDETPDELGSSEFGPHDSYLEMGKTWGSDVAQFFLLSVIAGALRRAINSSKGKAKESPTTPTDTQNPD